MLIRTDVLFFVEDPGSANYMCELPELLGQKGISTVTVADGTGIGFLQNQNVDVEPVLGNPDAEEILIKYRPKVLAVGTSQNFDSLGLRLIGAARSKGILSVGMIDMETDAELRFRGNSESALAYAPDWLIVPDESTKQTFLKLGFSCQRIVICGNPNYDRVRKIAEELGQEDFAILRKSVLPMAPLDGRPVVVFVSEHVDGCDYQTMHRSPEYTLYGRGGNDSRTAIVLEETLDALSQLETKPYVVVRLHPKNRREEFTDYFEEIDFLSIGGAPLKLIWVADLVVGMTSMLMMEAVLLGKRTLSVLPRISEKSWSPDTANGLTMCVTTREDLHDALQAFLNARSNSTLETSGKIIFGATEIVARFFAEKVGGGCQS